MAQPYEFRWLLFIAFCNFCFVNWYIAMHWGLHNWIANPARLWDFLKRDWGRSTFGERVWSGEAEHIIGVTSEAAISCPLSSPVHLRQKSHQQFLPTTEFSPSLAAGQPLPYISAIPPLFRRGDRPLYIKPGERWSKDEEEKNSAQIFST